MPNFTVHVRRETLDGQVLGPALYESVYFEDARNEAWRLDCESNVAGMHAILERCTGHIFWDVAKE